MAHARKNCLGIALALIAPVHAQTCSGGADGGMDPTGNLCGLRWEPVAALLREPQTSAVAIAVNVAIASSMPAPRCTESPLALPMLQGPTAWLVIPPTPRAMPCCAGAFSSAADAAPVTTAGAR